MQNFAAERRRIMGEVMKCTAEFFSGKIGDLSFLINRDGTATVYNPNEKDSHWGISMDLDEMTIIFQVACFFQGWVNPEEKHQDVQEITQRIAEQNIAKIHRDLKGKGE